MTSGRYFFKRRDTHFYGLFMTRVVSERKRERIILIPYAFEAVDVNGDDQRVCWEEEKDQTPDNVFGHSPSSSSFF